MNREQSSKRYSSPHAAGSCLIAFAAMLGMLALLCILGERLDVVAQSDLEMLHGTVFLVNSTGTAKVSPKINIYLRDGARVIHLTQDDFAWGLQSVRPHDQVTAWAKKDKLGRGLFWLWQLDRGTDRLLTYDETLVHETDGWRPLRTIGIGLALAAVTMALIGIRRRRRT